MLCMPRFSRVVNLRYHKKYLTWFQRHDQPKVTTDEYEQGTYARALMFPRKLSFLIEAFEIIVVFLHS